MQIFRCVEDDAPYVGTFYDSLVFTLIERGVNYPKWALGQYPSTSSAKEAIARQSQYMCVDDDWIVAAFVLDDDPAREYLHESWPLDLKLGEYLAIHALGVHPDVWGQGIGTEIIAFCAHEAQVQGCKALRADAVPNNARAEALYLSCGFEKVGESGLKREIQGLPSFTMYELAL